MLNFAYTNIFDDELTCHSKEFNFFLLKQMELSQIFPINNKLIKWFFFLNWDNASKLSKTGLWLLFAKLQSWSRDMAIWFFKINTW